MDYDKLTEYQKAAVDETGSILVSAAAGSGKTAVLVERIIRELTVKEPPLRADRLLVVTFTKAAAKEMRSRLERGIEDYCRKNPDDKQAAEQKILLGRNRSNSQKKKLKLSKSKSYCETDFNNLKCDKGGI